jgi:hypothetical protein
MRLNGTDNVPARMVGYRWRHALHLTLQGLLVFTLLTPLFATCNLEHWIEIAGFQANLALSPA